MDLRPKHLAPASTLARELIISLRRFFRLCFSAQAALGKQTVEHKTSPCIGLQCVRWLANGGDTGL